MISSAAKAATDIPAFRDIFIPPHCNASAEGFLKNIPQAELDGETDRYGETLVTAPDLQRKLVKAGLAVVYPRNFKQLDHMPDLFQAEKEARHKNAGCLWAKPGFIKPANAFQDTGEFMIAEGKIVDVYQSYSNIFLNFGENWKTDFTVRIEKKNKYFKDFDFEALNGQKIRARGFISFYNGPSLTLPHPVFLEVLSQNVDNTARQDALSAD
ncbi:MAG: thermonuclease family protein [Pseudomonadota bacterium]